MEVYKISKLASQFQRLTQIEKVLIKNSIEKENSLKNLRPNNILMVYHGTSLSQLYHMINGFDANEVKPRQYGGPRHAGLFVSPSIELADRFAHYGEIIMELEVFAKNLHGVDYSGNIGRKNDSFGQEQSQSIIEYAKELYPNSFRPYLTYTLTQSNEPQALLCGLVGPKQIKRIRYKRFKEEPVWYTRSEFLQLRLKVIPAKDAPYGQKKEFDDIGYDLSYPNYSNDELVSLVALKLDLDLVKARALLNRYKSRGREHLEDILRRVEIGETAAKRYSERYAFLQETIKEVQKQS